MKNANVWNRYIIRNDGKRECGIIFVVAVVVIVVNFSLFLLRGAARIFRLSLILSNVPFEFRPQFLSLFFCFICHRQCHFTLTICVFFIFSSLTIVKDKSWMKIDKKKETNGKLSTFSSPQSNKGHEKERNNRSSGNSKIQIEHYLLRVNFQLFNQFKITERNGEIVVRTS